MALAPVPAVDPHLGVALRRRFEELGITRDAIQERTERGDNLRGPFEPTRRARIEDDELTVAVRFFFCGSPETPIDLELSLGPGLFLAACDAGLFVQREDERWIMPFHLRPVRGLWLFGDHLRSDAGEGGEASDAVMGAGETTGILFEASHCADVRSRRILDLGCGAGSLALLLAGGDHKIIGTDINPRAVELARWNASMNGLGDVEFREGNLFEPVAFEQPFDLIVSQPPYYPLPRESDASLIYLHGGQRGDELATQILEEVSGHLSQNGRALVFTSWPSDVARKAPAGMRVLELTTNRREVHGTRQSLTVLEHSYQSRWTQFTVPADDWGQIRPARIDSLLAADDLLHCPQTGFVEAVLRLPHGVAMSREAEAIILRYPPESLVGTIQIDEALWRALSSVDTAPDVRRALAMGVSELSVRKALARGLLLVRQGN